MRYWTTVVALLERPGFRAGHRDAFALSQLRDNLLSSKSFPGHLVSPSQFNTVISSGPEKAGQVSLNKVQRK